MPRARPTRRCESDLDASEDNDDHNRRLKPFTDTELLQLLERWYFDHA